MALLEAARQGSFEARSGLRTYVHAYAHHKCIDRLRMARRRPLVEIEDVELRATEPSPFDHAAATEDRRELLRVLEQVPEDCRKMWRLLLQGASYSEMSKVLGVPAGALRVRVLRCRRKAVALREAQKKPPPRAQ